MTTSWTTTLTGVAANGNVTQLYPDFCTAGAGAGTQGEQVRRPAGGTISNIMVSGDGTNSGTLELYDITGISEGADVDTAATITNAQLVAALAKSPPTARKIADVPIAGTDHVPIWRPGGTAPTVQQGLAGRFVSSGDCTLNIVATGLFEKYDRSGT